VGKSAQLPPCFQPKLYVCPNPDCHYIGSIRTNFCWQCTHPLTSDNIHVFGQEDSELTKRARENHRG
jgi:hypothetical protein